MCWDSNRQYVSRTANLEEISNAAKPLKHLSKLNVLLTQMFCQQALQPSILLLKCN
ncbi:hypothetical protein Arad_9919 [Rhizobium rhizogenes K84]|uniref:Uncharacterized protein n=1 Tax=Rhizobium rhizogenes (strain K84 / ATCC BAA-868) TaxID=311403 RepID=B9JMA8_RHIR8|nr:hypothetical protein Arad_9919 [Rhizobium rhizogenes K84]